MSASQWLQPVKDGDLDAFELRCLEALEQGDLALTELVPAFEELERQAQAERAAALGQMVLENTDARSDPAAALKIACIALLGDPGNAELRERTAALYRQMHGDKPGFDALLDASGLTTGRPARNALRLLDACLSLELGDALISRTENVVVEVVKVDLRHGLVTLRHPQRPKTVTPTEFSREYERVAPDDFRVLRALRPEQLAERLQSDPVAVVIGLIRAHGELIDQDFLKRELVPKYIAAREWSKWWTRARARLQRSPHVIVEGRAPVLLRYTAAPRTLEDTTWEAFVDASDPEQWLAIIEGYLRDKRKHRELPDAALLARCQAQLAEHRERLGGRRPSEALACALVSEIIAAGAGQTGDDAPKPAQEMLRRSTDPAELIAGLESEPLCGRALNALLRARPEDAAARAAGLMPTAPASLLDRIVAAARDAGLLELVQTHIDTALADPVDYPELVYWLWRGPDETAGLRLPPLPELFLTILEALSPRGRRLSLVKKEPMKRFRQRARAALSLRDYAQVRACLEQTTADRAVTLRRQLERLEGIGANARSRMLNMLRAVHPELWAAPQERVAPWDDPDVLWNTAAGIRRKTEERDHLVNVTMRENAKRIGEAAAHGDLSENSEYRFALEERDLLRARLAQMNSDLARAEAIAPHSVPRDHVGIGSRVTLRDSADGSSYVLTFLGPFDADVEQGVYSYRAPLSLRLMGARVGDRLTLAPDGRERELEVVEIADGLPGDEAGA
jgi:transcription elongation GreA/GreB family factor